IMRCSVEAIVPLDHGLGWNQLNDGSRRIHGARRRIGGSQRRVEPLIPGGFSGSFSALFRRWRPAGLPAFGPRSALPGCLKLHGLLVLLSAFIAERETYRPSAAHHVDRSLAAVFQRNLVSLRAAA